MRSSSTGTLLPIQRPKPPLKPLKDDIQEKYGNIISIDRKKQMEAYKQQLFEINKMKMSKELILKEGTIISFGDGSLKAKVIKIKEEGITEVELIYDGILMEILEKLGTMPLPPYIHEKLENKDMYQTVYAKEYGSAAAPTAGLHFTPELLKKIEEKGIKIVHITLHVGLGTFRPVNVEDVTKHVMHKEHYIMTKEAADTLNEIREKGGKIYAVGTTSVRTLETIMQTNDKFVPASGDTSIFIYPGFKFKGIDGLITNFHLPKSTLVMLVSAFSSKENILNAYNEAVKMKYRFFSFGDAMLIK